NRRIIDAAQLDGIDAEFFSQLIQRTFECIDIRHDRWRTHEAWRIAVGADDIDLRLHGPECVQVRGLLDAGDDVGIGSRADLPAFMAVADDLAVLAGTESNMVARLGPVSRDCEALVAGRHELYRPI